MLNAPLKRRGITINDLLHLGKPSRKHSGARYLLAIEFGPSSIAAVGIDRKLKKQQKSRAGENVPERMHFEVTCFSKVRGRR